MTQLRQRVERLETAATTSTQYGATSNDLANFPGMMNLVAGSGVSFTPGTGTLTITATGGGGTVTSVGMSVPSFLSVSGSPVTTSGTLAVTYSGTALPIANGGSGQTTANAALNAFLPSQATHAGKHLQTDGTNTSWVAPATGTVTSVGVTGNNGIGVSGSPITSSGSITLSLGAITPTSVSTGALTASGAISLPSDSITRANLANGSACSVIGRSANSSGAVADISMGTNDRLLGRVSNVVQSTQLTAGMVPNALVTSAMLRNSAGLSVIGRSAATSGVVADITAGGARNFLKSSAAATALTFDVLEKEDFPGGDWIGATNGQTVSAGVTLAANSTWYTIADLSLAAGTYLILGNARVDLSVSAGTGYCVAEFYNATAGSSISNSQSLVVLLDNTWAYNNTSTVFSIVTIGSTNTIRFRAKRESIGATWASSVVVSDANGYSKITAIRIA